MINIFKQAKRISELKNQIKNLNDNIKEKDAVVQRQIDLIKELNFQLNRKQPELDAKDRVIEDLKKERAVNLEVALEAYNKNRSRSEEKIDELITKTAEDYDIPQATLERLFHESAVMLVSPKKIKDIHSICKYFFELRDVVADVFYIMNVRDGEYIDEEVVKYADKLDFALASLASAVSVAKDRKLNDLVKSKIKELENDSSSQEKINEQES